MKNSILTTFFITLGIVSMSDFLHSANPIIFKDIQGNIVSEQATYTEITAKNNPQLYISYQNFSNEQPYTRYTKICTIPGNSSWGTLTDSNKETEQNYLVCPCNKTNLNALDEICIGMLTNPFNIVLHLDPEKINFIKDKDGNSFDTSSIPFLKNFLLWVHKMKQKYPTIDFDNISWGISIEHWAVHPWSNNVTIYCPLSSILQGMSFADEGCLLHEMGHIQNHKNIPILWLPRFFSSAINNDIFFKTIVVATGIHIWAESDPNFKDYFNKYSSTSKSIIKATILTMLAAHTIHMITANIDERMADNFACKHADKKALIGLKDFFKNILKTDQEQIEKMTTMLPYEFKTLKISCVSGILKILSLITDVHPFTKSRIAKIEKAILTK